MNILKIKKYQNSFTKISPIIKAITKHPQKYQISKKYPHKTLNTILSKVFHSQNLPTQTS